LSFEQRQILGHAAIRRIAAMGLSGVLQGLFVQT
jgi:hypothetical protein